MALRPARDVYSAREIARAASVDEQLIVQEMADRFGPDTEFIPFAAAVAVGQSVAASQQAADSRAPLFALPAAGRSGRTTRGLPLALSSSVHAGVIAALLIAASLGSTTASTLGSEPEPAEAARLVYLISPGPGGGGGGGGARQRLPAPPARRAGRNSLSSPMPDRRPPPPILIPPEPPPPEEQPLNSEPLPVVVAPLATAPADAEDRAGVLRAARSETDSRGAGAGGGVGTGTGTGLGEGTGSGVGAGSGGGTGGGPFRPGAGITPPRLLREVKPDYSDEARRASVEGEVVLEIVVRQDGSVGDVRYIRRLGSGLDQRAVEAVRRWRFAPALRHGVPVDVMVEVAVEFRLR